SVTPHDGALSLSDCKPGRGHPKPLRRGGLTKPVVIGEQDTEIGAEGERRSARTAAVRSRVAEARSGHRPSAALRSADSRSVTRSLTKADVSRYATLPVIRAQLRQ